MFWFGSAVLPVVFSQIFRLDDHVSRARHFSESHA
jgi:hypothetical protein